MSLSLFKLYNHDNHINVPFYLEVEKSFKSGCYIVPQFVQFDTFKNRKKNLSKPSYHIFYMGKLAQVYAFSTSFAATLSPSSILMPTRRDHVKSLFQTSEKKVIESTSSTLGVEKIFFFTFQTNLLQTKFRKLLISNEATL